MVLYGPLETDHGISMETLRQLQKANRLQHETLHLQRVNLSNLSVFSEVLQRWVLGRARACHEPPRQRVVRGANIASRTNGGFSDAQRRWRFG